MNGTFRTTSREQEYRFETNAASSRTSRLRGRRTPGPTSRVSARTAAILLFGLIVSAFGHVPAALAQSGRNRDRQPPPQPKTVPPPTTAPDESARPTEAETPPPEPIPTGGLVAKQVNNGALTRYVLRNGLTLLVRENPATPLAAVLVVVRRGEASVPGAAAAAERMRAIGGDLEVAAWPGAETYGAVVPRDLVSDALRAQTALFEAPAATAAPEVNATAPDRVVIVVTGSVINFNVLTDVQHLFGALGEKPAADATPAPAARKPVVEAPAPPQAPVAEEPPAPAAREAAGGGLQYSSTRAETGVARVTVSYEPPAADAPDAPAAALLTTALAAGWGSRLGRALVWPGIAVETGPVSGPSPSADSLAIRMAVDPKTLDAAEATLFREVDRFRRERVSEGELQRARNMFERRYYSELETVDGSARAIARYELAFGATVNPGKFLDSVRAVTAADLQRAAARYLDASRATVAEVLPSGAESRNFTSKTFAETVTAWAPGAAREVAAKDVKDADAIPPVTEGRERRRAGETEEAVVLPVPLPARDFSTLNGPKAFVREDQSRPLISIGFFYPSGRAAEAQGERGVTELLLRSLLRGSKKYQADRLLYLIEQFGGEVRLVNEPDLFGVVVEVLSRNADPAMELAIDMVQHPSLAKQDVLVERGRLLADQLRAASQPEHRAVELFWRGRYPAHAYGVPRLGLPETVAKLDDEKVRAWFDRGMDSQYPLVGIVGDTDGSSLISRHVAEGFDRAEGGPPPTPGLPAPAPAGDTIERTGADVTAQAVGFPCPGGAWTELAALDVAAAWVGLHVSADLESSDAPAAGVASFVERRRLASGFLTTVVSRPGDEKRVHDAVIARLAGVAALPEPDLTAAKNAAVVLQYRLDEPFTGLLVDYVRSAAFATPLDSIETYGERVRATKLEAVRKAAAAVINPTLGGRGIVAGSQ